MGAVQIHFAFPSGALRYDCQSCDQRCCKTGLLALFARERPALALLAPALDLLAPRRLGELTLASTPYSGCWFLAEAACQLERIETPTRRVRPSACRLFPFNLFALHGEVLVVGPNALCPLALTSADGVTHAQCAQALGEIGLAGPPPLAVRCLDPADSLVLERVVREAAAAAVAAPPDSPLPFLAFVAAATQAFCAGGVPGLAAMDLARADELAPVLERRLATFAAILGVATPAPQSLAAIGRLLAAWTPSLRLFALDALPLTQLPLALLAIALFIAHWQSLRPARPVLPQTLAQLVSSMSETVALLAQSDPAALEQLAARLPKEPLARAHELRRLARTRTHGAEA